MTRGASPAATDAAPYEALTRVIERELEALAAGRIDELEPLARERAAIQARLPAIPPRAALPALERCALLRRRASIELLRLRELVVCELGAVEQVRRAARGYAPTRRRAPRVEASA